jgi:hypothetical protein
VASVGFFVTAEPAVILKVNPSNYRIEDFAAQVEARELAALANRHGVPLILISVPGRFSILPASRCPASRPSRRRWRTAPHRRSCRGRAGGWAWCGN